MADGTVRDSNSKTFSINSCSCLRNTPATAPASTIAKISSDVISSFLTIGILNSLKIRSAMPLNNQTKGRNKARQKRIGLTIFSAMTSGLIMPIRLGVKSASRINIDVTIINEQTDPNCCARGASKKREKRSFNAGEKADSPTIPATMATALRPICTTVKNIPGVSCIFNTRAALIFPSSTNCLSLIRREAASDISDSEKKALMAHSKSTMSKLLSI